MEFFNLNFFHTPKYFYINQFIFLCFLFYFIWSVKYSFQTFEVNQNCRDKGPTHILGLGFGREPG